LVGAWHCWGCEGQNPEGFRFCGHCGRPAQQPEDDGAAGSQLADVMARFVPRPVAEHLREGGSLDHETRLVTALFADVSGFTSLSTRLAPDELAAVIDPVIARISAVVGRYGGHIDKYAGDAVLALFGAPVGHEDDADRALLAALEMHEAVGQPP
jgi:adenylate cyclase